MSENTSALRPTDGFPLTAMTPLNLSGHFARMLIIREARRAIKRGNASFVPEHANATLRKINPAEAQNVIDHVEYELIEVARTSLLGGIDYYVLRRDGERFAVVRTYSE